MKLFGFFILGMDIFKYHRRIAQHYGLSLQDLFDREWPIEHLLLPEICLCPAAFDFPRKPRANCHFLDSGIRTDEPEAAKEGDFPWHSVKPDTPMVFCSFGSIILDSRRWRSLAKRVLTEIIRSFSGQSRFQLVVRVGARFDMSWAASLPDNIIIVNKWVPQLKLLQRASVYITHGGFSSVRESIEFQVPMIVIPFVNDQPGTAARVVYHNLGFRVMPKKVVGVEIVELSRRLCDSPTYKQNLSEMKLKFDRQREKQSAADLIESHLARR
jgi:MGT family glycosyltransferase